MARQERVSPGHEHEDVIPPPEPGPVAPSAGARKAELDSDIDSVLDEIDSVLESNAEQFVTNFVQKGGQ